MYIVFQTCMPRMGEWLNSNVTNGGIARLISLYHWDVICNIEYTFLQHTFTYCVQQILNPACFSDNLSIQQSGFLSEHHKDLLCLICILPPWQRK